MSYQRKDLITEGLIIFFVCLISAFGVAHFVVKAPTLNAQFAAEKREIKIQRFGALDLKEKTAKDYIKYSGLLKRYDG